MNTKLNSMVAERVMGWRLNPHHGDKEHYPYQMYERPSMDAIPTHDWNPSTDLNDALAALEKAANGNWWEIFNMRIVNGDKFVGMEYQCRMDAEDNVGSGNSAAIAMCLCALRCAGVPESEIQSALKEE